MKESTARSVPKERRLFSGSESLITGSAEWAAKKLSTEQKTDVLTIPSLSQISAPTHVLVMTGPYSAGGADSVSEQSTPPSPGSRRDELNLLVTEYNALRAELLDHYASQRTILQLYLAAVGIIAGFAVSGSIKPDIVVLIALVSPVFWWLHMNASARIELIDSYLRDVLSMRAQQLGSKWVFRWEDLKTWVWTNFPWRLVLRIGTGLHGNAWTMYLLPSALSLVWTGRDAVSIIFHLRADMQDQTILIWLWLPSLVFNVLLVLREIVSFRTWRINIDYGGDITLESKPAAFPWYWFSWHWRKGFVRDPKRGS